MKALAPLVMLTAIAMVAPALSATLKCPKNGVVLTGTKTSHGVAYSETVTLRRLSGGAGYDGRWAIDEFVQTMVYPWVLKPALPPIPSRPDFGNGMWMDCLAVMSGNTLTSTCKDGNLTLDVVGNRVGSKRTGVWNGAISGKTWTMKFDPNSPTEPEISGEIGAGPDEEVTLSISVTNGDNDRFRFDAASPGRVEMTFEATTDPPQHADDVHWTLPEIAGSSRTVQPAGAPGRQVSVAYEGLPAANGAFGGKTVTAALRFGNCTAEESREVELFYDSAATNNPGGQRPNWYYYWTQTPCAKPYGQTVFIDYGPEQHGFCQSSSTLGEFNPALHLAYATFVICDLHQLGGTMKNRFPLISHDATTHTAQFSGWRDTRYIDTFATLVIHEFKHWQIHKQWKLGLSDPQLQARDADWDGLEDTLETGMGFDPAKTQTYMASGDLAKIKYDEEWLAYEHMRDHQIGSCDKYDWSYPGAQWQ